MELEILDTYIIESCGDLEEHQKLIDEKVKELEPEYYTVDTDLIRLLWKTKIIVMDEATANIDVKTEGKIQNALEHVLKDSIKDKNGKYHDDIIYEIVSS